MEKKKFDFNFIVLAFITFCFIGWLYEVIWEAAIGHGFVNRGFLYGPYLPVYGFGVLILYFSLRKIMNKKIQIGKINITPIIVFLIILIMVSVIEYFTSVMLEKIFNIELWNYSKDILNINGRVSLRNSSILAAGAMVMLYVIWKLLEILYEKVNNKVWNIFKYIVIIVVSVDFICTIISYIK